MKNLTKHLSDLGWIDSPRPVPGFVCSTKDGAEVTTVSPSVYHIVRADGVFLSLRTTSNDAARTATDIDALAAGRTLDGFRKSV